MKQLILFPCLVSLFLAAGLAGVSHAEPFRGPWEKDSTQKISSKQGPRGINPLYALVKVYRKYISPIDGKECPMYPSCSEYSLRCFEKHGLFVGWVMTCDRLIHEADEIGKASIIYVNGKERLYDPLESNDFWWQHED
jgi:putative membrane protein insertion efficiency factor